MGQCKSLRSVCLGLALTAISTIALATLAQTPQPLAQGNPSPTLPQPFGGNQSPLASLYAQMLTPTENVDFSVYLSHVLSTVRRNWYAKMPKGAQEGRKGKVIINFRIQRDGTLLEPTIEESSRVKALDNAALDAIRNPTRFEHLPDAFEGPDIELRFSFSYNLPPQHQ
jgi:TonB family protein